MEKIEYKGLTIEIRQDDIHESPREWSNLGTLVTFHSRYDLGDKHSFKSPKEVMEHIKSTGAVWLPVFLYDHSGLRMNTTGFSAFDPQGWDSGQIGVIFVEREKILKEYDAKRLSKGLINRVKKALKQEIEVMDQYVSGDVYFYSIEKPDACGECGTDKAEFIDALHGLYGYEYAKKEALAAAEDYIKTGVKP